ncbi:MAG: AraC family transcriptional regulator [Bacteroidetes bacterium]|nr:AraC family transcriptional regulator [Bacteroidota bacterium]
MEIIAWLGVSHGIFAAILMLAKKERNVSDQILTAWLCLLAIEFLSCAIDINIFGEPLLSSSFLLFNPAFYLYVKSLTKESYKLKLIHLLHLLPFLTFKVSAYIIQEPYSLTSFFQQDSTLWYRLLFSVLSLVSWIFYNSASAVLVFKHRKRLKNEYSTLEADRKMGWLLFVVVLYNLYCGIAVGIGVYAVLMKVSLPVTPVYIYSTMLAFVYIFGFWGLIQKSVFIESNNGSDDEKYKKSSLTKAQKTKIKTKILDYFGTEKPHLNPEFSMSLLSKNIKIPKHQITEVLNIEIGKNFFNFVNEYRVEEVKKQLSKKKNLYSIEAIGYECGFSSKSTFFTVFKKITGITPSAYKDIAANSKNA